MLLLDADERVTENLALEIKKNIEFSSYDAFDVELGYWFMGRKLRFGAKARKRILLRPERVNFPVIDDLGAKNMWEVEGHYQPLVENNNVGYLENKLEHEDTGTLYEYFYRLYLS